MEGKFPASAIHNI
jgi:hypothetical protein